MGNVHRIKKSGFWLFLLLILTSCQKEDDKQESFHHFSNENVSHKMVTATDIPEVMQFLRANASPDLHFAIQIGELPEGQNRSGESDLIISELMIEQILAVTNEANLTNYSFQLRVDTAPYYEGEVSFFNLIVKETTAVEGYYAYIQEYRMDENWYVGNGSILDMHTYTGKMVFYTLEGLYLARVNFSNGQIIGEDIRSPCPNDDPGGGDPGGGGSGSGPGVGDGGSGGGTGGGSGTGGGGIQIIVIGCDCAPIPHPPGDTSCVCGTEIPGTPGYIIIVWGSEIDDINETLRSPCGDFPPQCSHPNGDPCPCNATNTGCIEENDGVGVIIIPQTPCQKLNFLSQTQNFQDKINELNTLSNALPSETRYEKGYVLNGLNNNTTYTPFQSLPNRPHINFQLPFGTIITGFMHNHFYINETGSNGETIKSLSVFSDEDIFSLYKLAKGGHISNPNGFTYVMVYQGTMYHLQITNLTQFINFVDDWLVGNNPDIISPFL